MDVFRDFVLDWLKRRGWSQARLAEASEISQSLISKYLSPEERKRVNPSPANLAKLAPVLDVPYEDLMRMCGFLPGQAASREQDDIEDDVKARLAEYLTAVRGAPEWAWVAIIKSTFDRAIDDVRDWTQLLPEAPPDNRVPKTSADTDSPRGSIRSSGRRHRPIKPRHLLVLAAT